ncbi:MAG: hypothetical protein H0T79_13295 [Deltaproteobacteria bacterium]|nr:hypothetical protein [Deltaproteobacteria bacterium]
MRKLAITIALLAGCKSTDAPVVGTGSGSAPPRYEAQGKKPANARRPTPPPGIADAALAVGAKAPTVALADASGATWTLADTLSKQQRVMLVFYRGDW